MRFSLMGRWMDEKVKHKCFNSGHVWKNNVWMTLLNLKAGQAM